MAAQRQRVALANVGVLVTTGVTGASLVLLVGLDWQTALLLGAIVSSTDAAAVLNWCRERLSHYKCPRSLEWVDDLGRNTMGKINKRKLRAPYWENAG